MCIPINITIIHISNISIYQYNLRLEYIVKAYYPYYIIIHVYICYPYTILQHLTYKYHLQRIYVYKYICIYIYVCVCYPYYLIIHTVVKLDRKHTQSILHKVTILSILIILSISSIYIYHNILHYTYHNVTGQIIYFQYILHDNTNNQLLIHTQIINPYIDYNILMVYCPYYISIICYHYNVTGQKTHEHLHINWIENIIKSS